MFGPIPRSYAEYVPKQMRQLARKSALNARAREHALFVIDRFEYDAPRTKSMLAMLERLGVADKKVLILTDGVKINVFLSGRNLPAAHVMPYSDVSTYHVLWSDVVLIEAAALGHTLEPLAEHDEEPAVKKAKPAKAAVPKTRAAKTVSKAAATSATKTAKKTAKANKKTAKAEKKSAKPAAKRAKKAATGGAKKKTASKKKGK